jgi:hypothetical protein
MMSFESDSQSHKKIQRPRLPLSKLRRGAELLALLALNGNEIATPEVTARARLNAELGATLGDECVEDLLRCGLVARRGFRIGFLIATVQEYLAGCALAQSDTSSVEIWFRNIARRPWAQALQFAVEKLNNIEYILPKQLAKPDDYFRTTLRLIAQSIVNIPQISQEFKGNVALMLCKTWLSSTYDIGQSIGRLLADGYAAPPPTGLAKLLKSRRAGNFGRIGILQRIGDGNLILECLDVILAETDIRELWALDWIKTLKGYAPQAVKMLLRRAVKEEEDSQAALVIAEVIYGLRDCKTVSWTDITTNLDYPLAVRAAAHFGSNGENSTKGRATIAEFSGTTNKAHCWSSFPKAFLSTTWWRDYLSQAARAVSFLKELENYLDISPQEPAAQELVAELRNLARVSVVPREIEFKLLLTLAANGDAQAASRATELLPQASDTEVQEWLHQCAYIDDDLKTTGIRSIGARPMSPHTEFLLVKDLNRVVRFVPVGVQRTLGGRGPFQQTSAQSSALRAAASWTFDALNRLELTATQRAELVVYTVENDYTSDLRELKTILQNYLARVSVIAENEWSWVFGAVNALSSRNAPIDIDTYWAVFDKGHDLPTGRARECIWSAQGMSCGDRLKRAFAERPEKRGEILSLLEKVAPLEGLSIRVTDNQLQLEGPK